MNKKGFTLIELLAVIVILAIVLVIGVMITKELTENAEQSAAERGAEYYVDAVEVAVGTARINGKILEGEYTILGNGNLCPSDKDCTKEPEEEIKIDMSGDKPHSGNIYIENGVVTNKSTMIISGYTIDYEIKGQIHNLFICEKVGKASKTLGAEYICHLDTDRTFYVLENNELSENISLIMDRNFTGGRVLKALPWCIDGGTNHTTCKNINSKEDNPLKYIQDTFGDSVEVSFPTKDQITSANNNSTSNLPQWLYDHLVGTPNPESGVYGYWTASPNTGDTRHAWRVHYQGGVSDHNVIASVNHGVRPVITIPKDKLN